MRKSKAFIGFINCILTMLIVFQTAPLQAVDQPEVPGQEKVQAADGEGNDDRSSGNVVSAASSPDVAKSGIPTAELPRTGVTTVEMAAMKDQLAKQHSDSIKPRRIPPIMAPKIFPIPPRTAAVNPFNPA